jgi:hypothetical protein
MKACGQWTRGKAIVLTSLILVAAGCSSNEGAITESNGRSPTATFSRPLAETRLLAVQALGELGCDITKNNPTYIRAHFASGEIVEIHLWHINPQITAIHVDSETTFVGGAWQRDRTSDVIWAINRESDSAPR